MQQRLQQILEGCLDNPAASSKALRELLDTDLPRFSAACLPTLQSRLETPGGQFLVGLLAARNLLVEPLRNPSFFSREEAIAVAQLGARSDPLLDVKLARQVRELTGAAAERVLSILDVISDGSRVVPLLAPLMRQSDPRLRSKVVLIIGRSIKKPEWVEQHLRDADARTRANAVESLWGVQSPEARGLFRKAVNDSHRRVATNAMVGLYRLGDPAAVSLLLETSRLRDPRFRSSAAWAMGEACDPRFLPPLRQIDPEPREIVWPSVRSAVERIERAAAHMWECGLLDARITGAEILADHSRRLRLAVAAAEQWEPLSLLATNFVIWENGRLVADYRVEAPHGQEPLVAGFVLGRDVDLEERDLDQAREAVLGCLEQKRARDFWAVLHHPNEAIRFLTDRAALRKALGETGGSSGAPCDVTEALDRLAEAARGARGSRHLIALAGPRAGQRDGEHVLRAALEAKATVHVIEVGTFEPPHALESLCRETGGIFLAMRPGGQIHRLYRQIYSSLLNRYEILYRPEPGPATAAAGQTQIQAQIYSGCGYGEALVTL